MFYVQTINTDNYVNNLIHFNKFCNIWADSTVYAVASGPNDMILTVPSQTVTRIGTHYNETHTFSGSGTDSTGLLTPPSIYLLYTHKDTAGVVTNHYTVWKQ